MTDDGYKKYDGKMVHQGADHASPYPVSRLAPSIELVDLAREISQADTMLGNVATAKLKVIADQMRALQEEARDVLESVQRDQDLHRVPCHFKRQPGKIYHLYRKPNGDRYFSMLSPEEWGTPPHVFEGTYRLEGDMSWTPAEHIDQPDDSREMIRRLLSDRGL